VPPPPFPGIFNGPCSSVHREAHAYYPLLTVLCNYGLLPHSVTVKFIHDYVTCVDKVKTSEKTLSTSQYRDTYQELRSIKKSYLKEYTHHLKALGDWTHLFYTPTSTALVLVKPHSLLSDYVSKQMSHNPVQPLGSFRL